MSNTYTLSRDGQRPIRFTGTRLAQISGSHLHGRDQNRYYALAVYQLTDGRYLINIQYVTQWQGESSHNAVDIQTTRDGVVQALELFNPTEWVEGYRHILVRE